MSGCFLTTVFSTVILLCHHYFGHVSVQTAIFFSFGSACLLNITTLRPILIAQLAAKRLMILDLITRIIMLLTGLIFATSWWFSRHMPHLQWMAILRLRPELAILTLTLGYIGGYVLVYNYIRPHIQWRQPLDRKLLLGLMSYSIQLAATTILYVLSVNITPMILRLVRSGDFSAVGYFARAAGISSLVIMVPTAIGPLLYAKWAGISGEARTHQGEMAMRMNIAFGAIMSILLLIGGKYLIVLLYGRAFLPANSALQILAPSLIFISMFGVCNNMLAGDGKALTTAKILLGTVCVLVAVSLFAVPLWSIRGSALSMLSANAFTAITSLIVCMRRYNFRLQKCLIITKQDLRYIRNSLRRSHRRLQPVPDICGSKVNY